MTSEANGSTIGWNFIEAQAKAIQMLAGGVSENDSVFRLIERRTAIDLCVTEICETLNSMAMVGGLDADGEWRRK